jgi:hypothetical protein
MRSTAAATIPTGFFRDLCGATGSYVVAPFVCDGGGNGDPNGGAGGISRHVRERGSSPGKSGELGGVRVICAGLYVVPAP